MNLTPQSKNQSIKGAHAPPKPTVRRAQRAETAALGKPRRSVPPLQDKGFEDSDSEAIERRVWREALRETRAKFTTKKRFRGCGRYPLGSAVGLYRREGQGVRAGGLETCGSVWACPICSAAIRHGRGQEIEAAVEKHLANGGGLVLATFTLPHDAGDRLASTFSTVQRSWRGITSGRAWMDDRETFGIIGHVRAIEVTHGENGWHPHIHALVFTEATLVDEQRSELHARLASRWSKNVTAQGFRPPSEEHGVKTDPIYVARQVGAYVSKIGGDGFWGTGAELTRSDLKKGRRGSMTPMQILAAIHSGDPDDEPRLVALWREYENATAGRHALRWSAGLRDHFGLAAVDDDDLLDEEQTAEDELISIIDGKVWTQIVRAGGRAALIAVADKLGFEGVREFVVREYRAPPSAVWLPPNSMAA